MVSRINNNFFFSVLIGAIALAAFIFLPFVSALILAIVLSVLCRPLHDWIVKVFGRGNERSTFAALISITLIIVIIIIPLIFAGIKLSSETQSVYNYLTNEESRSSLINGLNRASDRILIGVFGDNFGVSFNNFNITEYLSHALKWSFTNIDSVFTKFFSVALNIFLMFVALYYMLRDGKLLKRQLILLSPLEDTQDEQIFTRLERAIHSVVRGSLIVGVVQGVVMGLGLAIFGVPNPVLWGSITILASFIPGIGTALIIIPSVIYLFASGSMMAAVGLMIWGGVAVGLVDNFLGPMLMKRGVHIHQFIILLSVLGGLQFFGPIGFIAGPLLISLLFALLDIYKQSLRQSRPAFPGDANSQNGNIITDVK